MLAGCGSARGHIGVDSNQDARAPGNVLTSVLERIDVSVSRMYELAAAHKPRPRHVTLGLRENGVGLTDFAYTRAIVTPGIVAQLERIKAAIISGKISVPRTRAEGGGVPLRSALTIEADCERRSLCPQDVPRVPGHVFGVSFRPRKVPG